MASLIRNLQNREWLFRRLYAEVIGPDPAGNPVEIKEDGSTVFTWEEFRKPKKQLDDEEILWQDAPIKRYGAGILFPLGLTEQTTLAEEANSTQESAEDLDPGPDVRVDEELEKKIQEDASKVKILADDSENYDVTLANAYRPAAMGLSFLGDFSLEKEGLAIEISCATYRMVKVKVGYSREAENFTDREVWLRTPCLTSDGKKPVIQVASAELVKLGNPYRSWIPGLNERLELVIVARPYGSTGSSQRLLTVCLVNRQQKESARVDAQCFFQCGFRIIGISETQWIVPYPEIQRLKRKAEDEEEIVRLLYRDRQTFGIGHGCAVDWLGERPESVVEIWTDCLPKFMTPATSGDLKDNDGKPLRVSMRKLAGFDQNDDGRNELIRLIQAYRNWIQSLEKLDRRMPPISEDLRGTARVLIERCKECLARIEDGIKFLQSGTEQAKLALKAYQLANHSMLLAQLRSSREVRMPVWQDGRLTWDKEIINPDPAIYHEEKGYWRAFQIAFLLMSIQGICDPTHESRGIVDLIWFPTGGGKTEAYLGLAAFTIFYNRLVGLEPTGADVIMRYTLRLLTTQQFQRAGLLFCAMEHVRRLPKNLKMLGDNPFRVGIWVGGDATPNRRDDARTALRRLQDNPNAENPFVLLKCPWCNSKFGPADEESLPRRTQGVRRSRRQNPRGSGVSVYGYSLHKWEGDRKRETVAFRCNDPACEFGYPTIPSKPPLPIFIIDEDIYDDPPNLIIGTVDKFALLAWKPEIRSIFGIGEDGHHMGLPPTLIIQDELHLISGPLGSMVGAYETVIEELCTKRDDGKVISPKIIASTATISRAYEQIAGLYARNRAMLFPPSGLEAGDSFFAREEDPALKPGRLYVGVFAPGHGSLLTTEARVFATLLQYPAIMEVADGDESERDPWWTLVSFFNSLRELGGAATLLVADSRDYLRVILDRHGIPYNKIRQLLHWEELTSRVRSDRIPLIIQKLEIPFRRDEKGFVKDTLEACLASNIIEVGVDIDRLSLMTIVGQPKTTSQYIQVSSRIGRSPEAPGLVAVLYSQSKPRDRSHFERFRSYHQRLYAQVEPTSVTPYSPPAVDRALHGIIVATVRQLSLRDVAERPRPFPLDQGSTMRTLVENMIKQRVMIVDRGEQKDVLQKFLRRLREWKAWDPSEYGGFGAPPINPPLMYPAGSTEPEGWQGCSWPTLSSLRDVDATCEAEITAYYNKPQEDQPI
jgi:hypothetical protein